MSIAIIEMRLEYCGEEDAYHVASLGSLCFGIVRFPNRPLQNQCTVKLIALIAVCRRYIGRTHKATLPDDLPERSCSLRSAKGTGARRVIPVDNNALGYAEKYAKTSSGRHCMQMVKASLGGGLSRC